METVFLKLLNMSIMAGWLVLAIIALRLLLKKAPKSLRCVMWALAGIRLICPFSFESVFSLIPSTETIPQDILYSEAPAISSGISAINSTVNPVISESLSPEVGASVNPVQIVTFIASVIWITGMMIMLVYAFISYFRIYRKVQEAVELKDNIWLCDHISTPFILGILRPRIFLPSSMHESDMEHVIAHERAHLKRHDHWWKPIGFALLTVYWFNPLIWVAYILFCRDIELACDEKVIREMDIDNRKSYSNALINCSTPVKMITACPLAFGEVSVKQRVKTVLNYKRPAFWIILVTVAACIIVAVCFLTTPANRLDAKLQVFIDCEISSHHQSEQSGDNFCCLDYEVLSTKKSGDTTTIYMWVLYREYSNDNGLKEESGAHTLTAITVKKENGSYYLVEYWEPRDGSYYDDDIRAKIPFYLWSKAFDSQRYIDMQSAKCESLAVKHFNETASDTNTSASDDTSYIISDCLVYRYPDSVDPIAPVLTLYREDKSFQFIYSGFSSYIAIGKYEITDDTITLRTDDGMNTYVFNIENDTLIFDGSRSSAIPRYGYYGEGYDAVCPVPDKAVFELDISSNY